MKVVIVGGSVSGLMHGVMLKHHGHDVHILERLPRDLEAQGAGVSTADEVAAFLNAHDRIAAPLSLPSDRVRVFDQATTLKQTIHVQAQMCTWDAIYYRLRANFDRPATSHCPAPLPPDLPTDGTSIYDTGKEVTGIEDGGPDEPITVRYRDRKGQNDGEDQTAEVAGGSVTADLVIAADGAASTVKALLAPHAPSRQYAGYVAWRGIIPELSVSEATRKLLFGSFTFHAAYEEYAVVYPIPGKGGSLAEGERALNFVWYSWQPQDRLIELLTDSDGYRHRWSVPSGRLNREVWERQKEHGIATLSKEFGEMLRATETPFLQVVSDCPAPANPGPAFHGGRVLLVGDAQCVIRPHTGFALNQAARHCAELESKLDDIEAVLRMAKSMTITATATTTGSKTTATTAETGSTIPTTTATTRGNDKDKIEDIMADWNQSVLEFGHVARLRSIAIGLLYLKSRLRWVPAVLRWKLAEAWLALKRKWRGGGGGGGDQRRR